MTTPQEGKARVDGRVRLPVRLGNARFEPHTDQPQRPTTLVTALVLTALPGLANVLVGGVVLNLLLIGALPNSPGLSTSTLLTVGGPTYFLVPSPWLALSGCWWASRAAGPSSRP